MEVPLVTGGHNLPSQVWIGLTDLPKIWEDRGDTGTPSSGIPALKLHGWKLFQHYGRDKFRQLDFEDRMPVASAPLHFLANQLTLSQPGGGILYPPSTTCPSRFSNLATALEVVSAKYKRVFLGFSWFTYLNGLDSLVTKCGVVHKYNMQKWRHQTRMREAKLKRIFRKGENVQK